MERSRIKDFHFPHSTLLIFRNISYSFLLSSSLYTLFYCIALSTFLSRIPIQYRKIQKSVMLHIQYNINIQHNTQHIRYVLSYSNLKNTVNIYENGNKTAETFEITQRIQKPPWDEQAHQITNTSRSITIVSLFSKHVSGN